MSEPGHYEDVSLELLASYQTDISKIKSSDSAKSWSDRQRYSYVDLSWLLRKLKVIK